MYVKDYMIPGIDFQDEEEEEEEEENEEYGKMIEDANIGQPHHSIIWNVMDWIIEDAVRTDGLLGGLEPFCEAIEDYCIFANIQNIPDLYKYIFAARGGFLTQSKAINYLRDAWLEKYPTPLTQSQKSMEPIDPDFMNFLKNDGTKYVRALNWVKRYIH
jgi:hypothetical protein